MASSSEPREQSSWTIQTYIALSDGRGEGKGSEREVAGTAGLP